MTRQHPSLLASIGYSSGNFGKNLMAGSMDILFLFLATELLGLSPFVAGATLLCSMVLDAVLDPLVGVILDRAKGILGRPVSLLLIGAPLTGVTFSAVFHLPILEVNTPWLVAVALLAFRTAYSIIDLPHNILLTTAIPAGEERARVATYRFVFSTLATLVLALALKPMVENGRSGSQLSGDTLATLSIGMGLAAVFVVSVSGLSVARSGSSSIKPQSGQPYKLRQAIRAILGSAQCTRVIAAGALCAFGLPLFSKSLLFVADRVFGDVGDASNLLMAMVAGQFIGLVGWIALTKRYSTAILLRSAYWLAGGALLIAGLAAAWSYPAMIAATVLVGIGAAGSYALIWALLSDAVDHLQEETEMAAGGTVFGIAVLLQKASIGMSGLFLGAGLQLADAIDFLDTASVVVFCSAFFPAAALAGGAILLHREETTTNSVLTTASN
ncbi:MAG: MFS transporter [Pseudomonadota bacterium]